MSEWPARIFDVSIDGIKALLTEQPFSALPPTRVTGTQQRPVLISQGCGKRAGELHTNHIKPFAIFPELRFELANGRTLSVPCHKKTPTYLNRWGIKSRGGQRESRVRGEAGEREPGRIRLQ